MEIQIEKRGVEQSAIQACREECGKALDALWETPWIRQTISKATHRNTEALQEIALKIQEQSDLCVVIASGNFGKMIRAAVSALPVNEGGAEVVVFGDTLSSAEYARMLDLLEERDFSLLMVTAAKEDVAFRGAFAVLKQMLIGKYGKERAAERMYAVAGKESEVAAHDAAENDYPLITYPQEIPAELAGETAALLLPLAVMNRDIQAYLNGFYDLIASPAWDLTGGDYAMARALMPAEGREEILIWQQQLVPFGRWMHAVSPVDGEVLDMPRDEQLVGRGTFETSLIIEKDAEDIMTPFFEGCHEDGSLNLLLTDTATHYFMRERAETAGAHISIEYLDERALGQLFAFVQLSNKITEFLLLMEHK